PKGDMASLPLDYLVNRGVVVDISTKMSDWAVITPEIIESAGADIRDGDILLLHTGWHRHYEGQPQQDLVKYFCYHPGPNLDTLHWMLERKIKWWGMDTGSCDHAMNTSIRTMRPDLAAQFTKLHGKTPGEFFGTFEYIHKKSKRRVVSDVFPFHNWAFQEGLLHAENLGGDIELMLNKRALIGAFPWRYQGLEGCPCRIVAFLETGDRVEAVGNAAKAIMNGRDPMRVFRSLRARNVPTSILFVRKRSDIALRRIRKARNGEDFRSGRGQALRRDGRLRNAGRVRA